SLLSFASNRRICRSLSLSSSAACRCVIFLSLAFFNATNRSRSAWLISSCPWVSNSPRSTTSIGHFYFAQLGHSHFAATAVSRQLTLVKASVIIRGFGELSLLLLRYHLRDRRSGREPVPRFRRIF